MLSVVAVDQSFQLLPLLLAIPIAIPIALRVPASLLLSLIALVKWGFEFLQCLVSFWLLFPLSNVYFQINMFFELIESMTDEGCFASSIVSFDDSRVFLASCTSLLYTWGS